MAIGTPIFLGLFFLGVGKKWGASNLLALLSKNFSFWNINLERMTNIDNQLVLMR
jgi:hypothetical protein